MNSLLKVVVFFLCGILYFPAQTYSVQGRVVDFHNNVNLDKAKVTVGNYTAYTNEKGVFNIKGIPSGTYLLRATHDDCEPYEKEVNIMEDMFIRVPLEHHIKQIEEVTLKSKVKPTITTKISTLNHKVIQNNTTENLGNLLSKVSGVDALKTGNSITKPVIRGLYGSRVLVFNNNVRLAEQEWGVEHAPSVDINAFDNIKVVKGAQALKYGGDAIGGVVAMEPRVFPAKDTLQGKVMLTGISNGKGVHVNAELVKTWKNRWYVKSQGAYKKVGDYSTPDFSLDNTALEENTFSFGLGKRTFQQGIELYYSGIQQNLGIFRGSHIGFSDEFFDVLNNHKTLYTGDFNYSIDAPRQDVSHHLAKLSLYKRFDRLGKFHFDYSFQYNRRKEYDIRREKYSKLPSMDMELMTHDVQLSHLLEREGWQLDSGVNLTYQTNYPNPETGVRRLIPDYQKYDVGVYSIFQKIWDKSLKTELGVRYDYNYIDAYKYYTDSDWQNRYAHKYAHFFVENVNSKVLTRPQFGFHNFSANLGVQYQPFESTLLRANVSRSSRTPNPAELFADGLHHSASIIERGNLDIRQEETYQLALDIEQKINLLKGWKLSFQPYLLLSDNFIQQVPTEISNTIRGIFPVWDYQQVKARMYGGELDSELKITDGIQLNSNYSQVVGDDLTNKEPLFLMAPARLNNQINIQFLKKKNGYFNIENSTVFRQNRFSRRDLPITLIRNNQLIVTTLDLSTPPEGYSIFNVSAGIDWTKNFSTHVKVNNVLNKNYRTYLNRLRYYSDEIGRNFLVTLSYKF